MPDGPKPTPADLRKSAEQMRDMAKWSKSQAAEARAKEAELDGSANEAEQARAQAAKEFWDTRRELGEAEGRLAIRQDEARYMENAANGSRASALSKDQEAARIQATDPDRAQDLREEAARLRARADGMAEQASAARAAATQLSDEVKALTVKTREAAGKAEALGSRVESLREQSEQWERQAEEHEAIAKTQDLQATELEASAETLEIESGEPQAIAPAAGEEWVAEQDAAAQEVLAAVEPMDDAMSPNAPDTADAPTAEGFGPDPSLPDSEAAGLDDELTTDAAIAAVPEEPEMEPLDVEDQLAAVPSTAAEDLAGASDPDDSFPPDDLA